MIRLREKSFWRFLMIAIVLVAGICFISYYYYRLQTDNLFEEKQQELLAIADLKIAQIVDWRNTRMAEANFILENRVRRRQIEQYLAGGSESDIQYWMASFRRNFIFSGMYLVDLEWSVRIKDSLHDDTVSDVLRSMINRAYAEKRPIFSDFHTGKVGWGVHLDIVVPLFRENEPAKPLCAIVLRLDPNQFIFPLIKSWPTPSKSAETVLVERVGDEVVFINELRHERSGPMQIRFPVSSRDLPAVMAVLGRTGVVEGKDYRGVPVVAAIRPVADTPWYVIAKIDRSEIYAPIKGYFIIAVTASALFSIIALLVLFILERGGAYLEEMKNEEHYRETLDNMLEGCQIIGYDWNYKYVN
ncbi:MAG TPA: hypothetical protein VMD02_03125, partial [Candidatus Omnitrophota bacterium]|nr:hypothetical protein [Candidatus Omnitrophota bacterium]